MFNIKKPNTLDQNSQRKAFGIKKYSIKKLPFPFICTPFFNIIEFENIL